MNITPQNNKKLYFVSDAHFGLPNRKESRRREDLFVQWLSQIQATAEAIFFVGDIFDFWWEYKRVVPAGYIRLLGKLAELADSGIALHFFYGNHDMWMRYNYFGEELPATIHPNALHLQAYGYKFYITHGDGLGPGDHSYKLLKWGFRNKMLQGAMAMLHPDIAHWLGQTWSSHNKYEHLETNKFFGKEEFLYKHSLQLLHNNHFDYFVYGHRHTPVIAPLGQASKYVNLGDWLQHFSYAVCDGHGMRLEYFEPAFADGMFERQARIQANI